MVVSNVSKEDDSRMQNEHVESEANARGVAIRQPPNSRIICPEILELHGVAPLLHAAAGEPGCEPFPLHVLEGEGETLDGFEAVACISPVHETPLH